VKDPRFRKKKAQRDLVAPETLQAEVVGLYDRAEAACDRPDLAHDRDYNLLATSRAASVTIPISL
jgi:hypothetical protein